MIQVTRLNGTKLYVNAEMIRFVEGTPDTVISLTDGVRLIVREAPPVVVAAIVTYRRQTQLALPINQEAD